MADPISLGLVLITTASLASTLLGPKGAPENAGGAPRVGDTGVSSSAYGEMIPVNYGTVRAGTNMIWATDLVETKQVHKSKVGKGGSQSVTQTSFSYFLNAAYSIGEGVVSKYLRIWADNKLIYDGRPSSQTYWKYPGARIRFYYGDEAQNPDPLIESVEGVGNVSGHRGVAYFVVENMPVADFSNHPPQMTVEASWAFGDSYPERTLFTLGTGDGSGDLEGDNPNFLAGGDMCYAPRDNLLYAMYTASTTSETTLSKVDLLSGSIIAQVRMKDQNLPEAILSASPLDEVTTGTNTAGMEVDERAVYWCGYPNQSSDARYFSSDRNSLHIISYTQQLSNQTPWEDAILIGSFGTDGEVINAILGVTNNGLVIAPVDEDGIISVVSDSFMTTDPTKSPPDGPGTGGTIQFVTGPKFGFSEEKLGDLGFPDTNTGKQIGVFNASGDRWGVFFVSPREIFDSSMFIGFQEPATSDWQSLEDDSLYGDALACYFDETNYELLILVQSVFSAVSDAIVYFNIGTQAVTDVVYLDDIGVPANSTGPGLYHAWRWLREQPDTQGPRLLPLGADSDTSLYMFDIDDKTIFRTHNYSDFGLVTSLRSKLFTRFDNSILIPFSADSSVHQLFLERASAASETVSDVLTKICARVGLSSSDIDVSTLTSKTVRGMEITRRSSARDAVDRMSIAYLFDTVESNYKLKFVARGTGSVQNIDYDDLGAAIDRLPEEISRVDENEIDETEIPYQIDLKYTDYDRDYQAGDVYQKRQKSPDPTVNGDEIQKLELPVVLTSQEAQQLADTLLAVKWSEKFQQEFFLPYRFLALDPSDSVTLVRPNCPDTLVRLSEMSFGSGMVTQFKSVEEDTEVYTSLWEGGGQAGFTDRVIPFVGSPFLYVLDLPLIQDSHSVGSRTGFYTGSRIASGEFRGVVLHQSLDQLSWVQVDVFDEEALGGIVLDAAPANLLPFQLDVTTSIRIAPFDEDSFDAFVSITEAQLYQNNNPAAWGNNLNGYELVKFQNVTDNGDGTVTLDTFIRGRRGTSRVAEVGHPIGENFLLLRPNGSIGSWSRQAYEVAQLGSQRFFRVTPLGQIFEATDFFSAEITGTDLKPYEAVHIVSTRGGSNQLDLSWVRQTRISGQQNWNDGVISVPLAEESHTFEVVLLAGPGASVPGSEALSKTFVDEIDTLTDSFTVSEQSAAGYSISDPVDFVIYQISGSVGRGFPAYHTAEGV